MGWHTAFDLGSSGGAIWIGRREGDHLELEETYRFDNRPVEREGRHVWDIDAILSYVEEGLVETERDYGELSTIAVDTTAMDFTFFKDGERIRDPYFYRDPVVSSTLPDILERTGKHEIFMHTGLNHWNIPNSLWQYHYQSRHDTSVVEEADTFVMLPQILTHEMGGSLKPDKSIASTTQMFDIQTESWATELLEKLDLRTDILPDIVDPGKSEGPIDPSFAPELDHRPELLKGATHDTAGVVAAIPFETEDRTFLATGSLFACGMELDEPQVTEKVFEARGCNEYGVEGTTRFLKDVTGFNLLEAARDTWAAHDQPNEYDEILSLMDETEPFGPLIDPDASEFVAGTLKSEDMVTEIQEYCEATGQRAPEGVGEVTRCILESLAAKIAYVFEELQAAADIESQQLHVVGGGARNEPFLQMISGATNLPVVAGPVEAGAIGNILVQMNATDEIEDIAEGRALVRRTVTLDEYEPQNRDEWEDATDRVASMVESDGFH